MPDTYDLPVTQFQGAQSGITLRPQNYERSVNSMSTRQQMHVKVSDDGELEVETYGREDLSGEADLSEANPPFFPAPAMPSGY